MASRGNFHATVGVECSATLQRLTMSFEAMFFVTMADINFSRPLANHGDEDVIYVVCPGEVGVGGETTRAFVMQKSALMRSAPLDQFFKSNDYRWGCAMTLYFTQLPGVCFSVVKQYLEMGSDRYTTDHLIGEVSSCYTDGGKRLEIYSRLHKSAHLLELFCLENMAWAAIKDEEGSLSVGHCVTLASFILTENSGFGHLKGWLMGHIKKYFEVLNADFVVSVDPETTWNDIVGTLSPRFRKEWKKFDLARGSRLSMVEEEQDEEDEEIIAKALKSLDEAELWRAEDAKRSVEDGKDGMLRKDFVSEAAEGRDDDEFLDGLTEEEIYEMCPFPEKSHAADTSKAHQMPGAPLNSRSHPRSSAEMEPVYARHSSLDMETAKARAVLGINTRSTGLIAGRRKQPVLTRATKSLASLMRSPSMSTIRGLHSHK